jgi:hypothetical protein
MQINLSRQMLEVIHEALAFTLKHSHPFERTDGHGYVVSLQDACDMIEDCIETEDNRNSRPRIDY